MCARDCARGGDSDRNCPYRNPRENLSLGALEANRENRDDGTSLALRPGGDVWSGERFSHQFPQITSPKRDPGALCARAWTRPWFPRPGTPPPTRRAP